MMRMRMRMMFNAFVGGNDIIPDDPDTAKDLDTS